MLLYLLFAVAAFGQECESGTCLTCKAISPACDWYGFDCLSNSSKAVTSLKLTPTSPCPVCQAGNCNECQNQTGCSWFKSDVPGVSGKCELSTETPAAYTVQTVCPACFSSDTCDLCTARENISCGWYVLPGGVGGKCRESSPSFAYSQVPKDSCAAGFNPCNGVSTCKSCQDVVNNATNASLCSWFTSKSPSFYNSKCDDKKPGVVNNKLYTEALTCPACAGTNCVDCKAEANCKWAAVQFIPSGTGFGECLQTTATIPAAKKEIPTCPSACKLHTCASCKEAASCSWFTGSSVIDDSCDLTSDAKLQHPAQNPAGTCGACWSDRCYECNGLSTCGWYVKKVVGLIVAEGCYATASAPAGRELLPNTDKKCDGVPGGSAQVVASAGILLVLALLA